MPWILCAPLRPSLKTGESSGSTATIFRLGLCSFKYAPAPESVPPVPTPATKISTFPSVSFQISEPVVFLWASGFAGFINCPGINEFSISAANSSALAMAPFIPLAPSVKTNSAPYAFNKFLLSTLIVSVIVKIILYPLAAATDANPIPVFPLVGSMITAPFFSLPFASASSISCRSMPISVRRSSSASSSSITLPDSLSFSSSSRSISLFRRRIFSSKNSFFWLRLANSSRSSSNCFVFSVSFSFSRSRLASVLLTSLWRDSLSLSSPADRRCVFRRCSASAFRSSRIFCCSISRAASRSCASLSSAFLLSACEESAASFRPREVISDRSFSVSSLAEAMSRSAFSRAALAASSSFLVLSSVCTTSFSSRPLPRRLDDDLKAPPEMAPPGDKFSPSKVTMCRR